MQKNRIPLAVAALCAAAAAFPASAQDRGPSASTVVVPDEVTEVTEVVVRSRAPDWLLTVTVAGDIGEHTFVSSAPIGLNCGGEQFQYFKTVANRQCWLRVRDNRKVLLSAQENGRFGETWTVEWHGCTPLGSGAMCEINSREDAQVGATFRRLR